MILSTLIGRHTIVSPIHVDIISNRAMSALRFFFSRQVNSVIIIVCSKLYNFVLMKKKTVGKTISFHGQWQSKPESEEMIYLFIYF